jgi:hypothetical protein
VITPAVADERLAAMRRLEAHLAAGECFQPHRNAIILGRDNRRVEQVVPTPQGPCVIISMDVKIPTSQGIVSWIARFFVYPEKIEWNW